MVEANDRDFAPALLGAREMAELLAALVAHGEEVAMLVAQLAPATSDAVLDELERLGDGLLDPEQVSAALRWILPEVHRELGRRFSAARA